MKGVFISFEGIEGTGKSTQARLLAEYLGGRGYAVVLTAEPGGTPISFKIRELLLSLESRDMDHVTELLLYNAARVQHIRDVIGPALLQGSVVITDRFSDSTLAYQGYGRGIERKTIDAIDTAATGGMKPDLTLLLDVDVETGLRRNRRAHKQDRLELEDIAFHRNVQKGFHEIAAAEPERVRIVPCAGSIATVHEVVRECVMMFLAQKGI